MKRLLLALISALALSAPAHAQQHIYTQPELDALLAPIALYPDGLVTQVLEAAKHPDQVAAAARLPKDAQPDPSWDPNVQALLAFPEILGRMGESPQWTADLGQAFASQEPHVLDTVQALRKRAQQSGTLKSNEQTTVTQEPDGAVVVQPRNPEVVYVPYYDPYVVYGPWWWPGYAPVVWSPWIVRPAFVGVGFFWGFPSWHAHTVVVNQVNIQRTVVRPAGVVVQRNVVVRDFHRPAQANNWSQQQWNGRQWQPRQDGRQSQPRADARQSQQPQQRWSSNNTMPAATRYSDSRQQATRTASSQGQTRQAPQQQGGEMRGASRGSPARSGGWGGGQRMGGAGHGGGGHRG